MSTIVTRAGKGSPLTHTELDANFTNLNTDKAGYVTGEGGTFGAYTLNGRAAAGSATIDVRNVSAGALLEAVVIGYAVVKAVTA